MRLFGILALMLILGACQGPALGLATPWAATTAEAPVERPAGGFHAFLEQGGETATGLSFDADKAIDTILETKANQARRSGRRAASGGDCPRDFRDEIDRIACERGVSRDHARQIYKNTPYRTSAKKPAGPRPSDAK